MKDTAALGFSSVLSISLKALSVQCLDGGAFSLFSQLEHAGKTLAKCCMVRKVTDVHVSPASEPSHKPYFCLVTEYCDSLLCLLHS